MFAKPPFTYFEVTSHPNTFCKNNPRFFYNYKNTLFTCTLNFQKLHMNIHKLYINNTYFTLTVNMSSLQVHELSQPSPLKRISSRDSGRKTFNGRGTSHPSKVAGSSHIREVKAVGVWQDEYSENMDRLYMDEFDERREKKVIKFSQSWDHNMRTINVGDIHHTTYG
jgi:hypothetical protein